MNIITVLASALPARGHLVRDTLVNGHVPGKLSLARLTGKAARYPSVYLKARAAALAIAAAHGVSGNGTVLINSRHCRVWQRGGAPVRIEIGEG